MRGLNAQAWVIEWFPCNYPLWDFRNDLFRGTTAARKVECLNIN